MTQKQIAEEMKISVSTLNRWLADQDQEKEEKILNAVERIKSLKG